MGLVPLLIITRSREVGAFPPCSLPPAPLPLLGHSPENMILLRRMAISLLNHETSTKRSLRQKALTGFHEQRLHAQGPVGCFIPVAYFDSFSLALTLVITESEFGPLL